MARNGAHLAHVVAEEHYAPRYQQDYGRADGRGKVRIDVFNADFGEDGRQSGKESGKQSIIFPHTFMVKKLYGCGSLDIPI